MEHNIYEMKLFEKLIIPEEENKKRAEILRVPGGWIFTLIVSIFSETKITSVFVPINYEFMAPITVQNIETWKEPTSS